MATGARQMKIKLSIVLVQLFLFGVLGVPFVDSSQNDQQCAGFPKAFVFSNSSSKLILPVGTYLIRLLAVGGGGGGCYSDNNGRGKAGQVVVRVLTMSINQTKIMEVVVGRGSDEAKLNQAGQPANKFAKSRIFDLKVNGGVTCVGAEFARPKEFEHFFMSKISYGRPGNDSRPPRTTSVVRGGQSGILINNTGPTAQSGQDSHSSGGGVGYGAGGGSGGKFTKSDGSTEIMSGGGKGAPGVVYVEVVPKVCQVPLRVLFAVDGSADLNYQIETILHLLNDFFNISKDTTKVSLLRYGNVSSLDIAFGQKNALSLLYKMGSSKSKKTSSVVVDFERILSIAINAFKPNNDHETQLNPTQTLVIFTNGTKITPTEKVKELRQKLRGMGIKILVVGLTKKLQSVDEKFLKRIFEGDYVFFDGEANGFIGGDMVTGIANLICRAQSCHPNLPTTTPPALTTQSPQKRPQKILNTIERDFDYISNYDIAKSDPNNSTTVEQVLTIADDLIRNSNKILNTNKTAKGLNVLQFLEDYGLHMATKLDIDPSKNSIYKYFEHGDIGMAILSYRISSADKITLPRSPSAKVSPGHVTLPREAFGRSGKGSVVWLSVDPVVAMGLDNNSLIVSKIMMLDVHPKANHTFQTPVELTFAVNKVKNAYQHRSTCEFWDSTERSSSSSYGEWSSEGCIVIRENKTSVSCQCNHLTSFAVLTRIVPRKDALGEHEEYLSVITYVGCILSILGCILTIVIHACLPSLRTERTFIHLNLVTAILIAQCLFLVAASIRGPKGLCFSVAVGLYLFYLCVFAWMLVEGLHIYCLVIRVFHSGHERKRLYAVIGWVLPAVITTISAVSFREDFTAINLCWLSTERGAIWAFVGPALVIIAINLVILVMVLRVTATVMIKDETQSNSNKSLVKACITLLPILGLTWIFGILAINNKTVVFEYLFCIFNSIQGLLVFFFYCIGSSEVRREVKRKLHNYETKRSLRSSSSGFKTNKQNSSIGGKLTKSAELICERNIKDNTRL